MVKLGYVEPLCAVGGDDALIVRLRGVKLGWHKLLGVVTKEVELGVLFLYIAN